MTNKRGKPMHADKFVPFNGDGTAPTWPSANFDDECNWLLVTALVTDPAARVTNIFVAAPLRARLLAYAARIKAPLHVRERAAELMMQPRGAQPHDDHFHVRIACPSGMRECIEFPPRRQAPNYARVPLAHGRRDGVAKGTTKPQAPAKRAVAKNARRSSELPVDDVDGDL